MFFKGVYKFVISNMKRLISKKYVNLGFIAALVILISVNIVIYLKIRFHFEDENIVSKSLLIIQASESLYSGIIETETNRRGYLITKKPEFLKEYYSAVSSTDSSLINLKLLISGNINSSDLDTLEQLIKGRIDFLEKTIIYNSADSSNIESLVDIANKGRIYLDVIKQRIDNIQHTEKKNLTARMKESDDSSQYALTNLIYGNIVAFTLLILAFVILNKTINRGWEIENTLEENRNWLATTFKSIGDAVIVTGKIGEVLFLNNEAEKLTGWLSNDANGMMIDHVFNIISEDTRLKETSPVHSVINGFPENDKSGHLKSEHSILISKKSAEIIIDKRAAPIIDKDGSVIGAVLVFRDVTEKRIAEKELLKNKKFIERIADSVPSIIYIYSLTGPKINYLNYKIADLLGHNPKDIVNMKQSFFDKYIHPDDLTLMKSNFRKYYYAEDNETLNFEYRIKDSSGSWRWFRSFDVVFNRNNEGKATEILGSAFDVTERKKLEQELQNYSNHLEELVENRTNSLRKANEKLKEEIMERAKAESYIISAEEKFRNLVEYSLIGIYILQEEKYIYVNPKYEEIFGYLKNEMNGMDIWSLIHPDSVNQVRENIRKRVSNEVESIQYSFKAFKKDLSVIDVEVRGSKMMYRNKIAIIGTLQDITERKKAEEELIRQRAFLRTVIDTDPNFVFAKDYNGRFTMANKAFAEAYNTTADEMLGKTDSEYNANKEEVEHFTKYDREVIDTGIMKFIPEERVTDSASGETKWYQTIKVPLNAADGSVNALGVSADITARKHAEQITQNSLHEKEVLLREIHHRVKNNLQIIISLLKMQARFVFDERDLEIFNKSRSRVETMSLIHEKLYKSKDISKIEMGSYLRDLTSHILNSYKLSSGCISVEVDTGNITLGIDTAIPCGLIVNELFTNIIKHAFPGGQKGEIFVVMKKSGDILFLDVHDNGTGIPGSFNFKDNDSLGFHLVETLVRQIDGKLLLHNDKGTKFNIEFREIKYKERI